VSGREETRKTAEKLRGCEEDFVAACLLSFTLTLPDTSNLSLRNGKWNIFEVPQRPLAESHSSRINQLRMSVYLDFILRKTPSCSLYMEIAEIVKQVCSVAK
jgi:hypothetical protein